MITCEGIEVLCRDINAYAVYISAKPLVWHVVTKFYVGDLPISGILNLTTAKEIVPSLLGVVGSVSTWYIAQIGFPILTPAVGIAHGYIFVAPAIAGVQTVVNVVGNVIAQGTEGRNTQIEALVLQMGTDTKVDFRHTAAKDDTVVLVDFAIGLTVRTTDILVEAVTDIGSLLGGMVVEVGLRAGDALIDITVELSNLFSKFCDIVARDIGILAETKLHHLILNRAEVGTDLIFQRMIVIAISTAELPTTVIQSSGVHRYAGVAHTGILRNRYSVEQILRTVLEPFSSELKTVAKHGEVETNVLRDTALPLQVLIDEGGDS